MKALPWAWDLKGVYPEVKLLAIYVANWTGGQRYCEIDAIKFAEFAGLARNTDTVLKLAKQIPGVPYAHELDSQKIRFDLGKVVPGLVE
jgi:hypothetical protein